MIDAGGDDQAPVTVEVSRWVEQSEVTLIDRPLDKREIYMYYTTPELRIGDYRFRSGKGAGPL